jgi:hypothetical protein
VRKWLKAPKIPRAILLATEKVTETIIATHERQNRERQQAQAQAPVEESFLEKCLRENGLKIGNHD